MTNSNEYPGEISKEYLESQIKALNDRIILLTYGQGNNSTNAVLIAELLGEKLEFEKQLDQLED